MKDQVIEEIDGLMSEGEGILKIKWRPDIIGASTCVNSDIYAGWHTKNLIFLTLFLSADNPYIVGFSEKKKTPFFLFPDKITHDTMPKTLQNAREPFLENSSRTLCGATRENRTPNLRITNALLYR